MLSKTKTFLTLSATWSSGLKRPDCDRHGLGSKVTRAVLLCPWKRHFPLLVVLASSYKFQSHLYKTKKPK